MKKAICLIAILTVLNGLLSGCVKDSPPPVGENSTMTEAIEKNKYTSIKELYGDIPANFTERENWSQWINKYKGKPIKVTGMATSISMHPQAGKLFFIITVDSEKNSADPTTTQVALFIEDAHNVALGEKEGSFLIDDSKWIRLGENYAIDGEVFGFSRFDPELMSTEHSSLIIIGAKMTNIISIMTQAETTSTESH